MPIARVSRSPLCVAFAFVAGFIVSHITAARAAEGDPAVCLVMLQDVSGSMTGGDKFPFDPEKPSENEYMLVQRGTSYALRSERVKKAIKNLNPPLVGIFVDHFSTHVQPKIAFTLVSDTTIDSLADQVDSLTRNMSQQTGIGGALNYAIMQLLQKPACANAEKVIDVAGDGEPNHSNIPSISPFDLTRQARDKAEQLGIRINGLYMINPDNLWRQPNLGKVYKDIVITSDGFPIEVTGNIRKFPDAMAMKLEKEFSQIHPSNPTRHAFNVPAQREWAMPTRGRVNTAELH